MLFVIVSGINQYSLSPGSNMFQIMQKTKQKACFTENFLMLVNIKPYPLQPLASSRISSVTL